VHEALSGIARRRGALDAEEARWLRLAEQARIWRHFGMVSPLDYLERKLGYAPHTAQERLRVAAALGELPATERALADGVLAFSAVRELTRVATAPTECAWIVRAVGMNVREVEQLVAGHQRGDHPDDPPDPELRRHRVMFELSPETFARLRQARAALADEHGRRLDDDAFIAALCEAVLESTAGDEPRVHAKYQMAKITVCESCDQAWQEGGGVAVPIDDGARDRALCDATHIGSIDSDTPGRATQTIPPAMVRHVWHRDGGRCRVPGCRSARGLEVHHLTHRAAGGGHDAKNLVLTCSSCHAAHHRGDLILHGSVADLRVVRPADPDANGPRGTEMFALTFSG